MSEPKLEEIFGRGSDSAKASALKRTNPALYAKLKKEAQEAGRISTDRKHWAEGPEPRKFSDEELRLRAATSERQTRDFFSDGDKVSKVKRENVELYNSMRFLAESYNILPPRQPVAQKPKPSELFTLEDGLADQANLPRKTQVDFATYEKILKNVQEVTLAREAAKQVTE